MSYFDSHCHLQLRQFDDDREETRERALEAGVKQMTVIGIDAETSRDAISFCDRHDGCYPTVGLHPHDAELIHEQSEKLRPLLQRPDTVAVGETGLDFHKEYTSRTQQEESLATHINWAIEFQKPLVFHCRDADEALIDVLEQFHSELSRAFSGRSPGVVHCFSGTREHLEAYQDMGFYVSGILTFPNAGDLREAASAADPERVLMETDSPFLAPQEYRGDRNEPAYVTETADRLASVLDMSPTSLADRTRENATKLFLE